MDHNNEISHRTLLRGKAIKLMSVLTILQIIFSLAVLGIEAWSISVHSGYQTIYAGFWCFPFFLLSWVSMLIFICSYRSIGFEFCLIIFQILSGLAALVLLIFSAIFLSGASKCIGDLCDKSPEIYPYYYPTYYYYYYRNFNEKKIHLSIFIAFASALFLTNLTIVIMYIVLFIVRSFGNNSNRQSKIIYSDIVDLPKSLVGTVSEAIYYSGDNDNDFGSMNMPSAPPNLYYNDLPEPFAPKLILSS